MFEAGDTPARMSLVEACTRMSLYMGVPAQLIETKDGYTFLQWCSGCPTPFAHILGLLQAIRIQHGTFWTLQLYPALPSPQNVVNLEVTINWSSPADSEAAGS